ncbi:hypothetical protein BJ138DRAFT_1083028 [Hygrophoropsis aurantiaca]|uniref:Uncharacterized protein n=1 Tax=Hygrophoropsis aurantiaca TaxID=72124 RepID=A0ACB8AHP0_9AGAM|nr:hypothetical protein BJ138DRAFT_1083028 [Hygrophoropsis aurantiaca]
MANTRRTLNPPPQTQALSSATFRPPPLDGSLTIPEIYDWHLEHTPNHRLFVYAQNDGNIRSIFWPEAVRAIHVAANIIKARIGLEGGIEDVKIVAILASSDCIPYFITKIGIMRANHIAFLISPRNSPTAVAHLLEKVGVDHILVGGEQVVQDLANDALDILRNQYSSARIPELSAMFVFEELFLEQAQALGTQDMFPYTNRGPDATVLILHSSGSTAFPKPIRWTNYALVQQALVPWFGERDLTGKVFSVHTMPMYHGMGMLQTLWTASSGYIISAFEPKCPPIIPSPDTLFVAAKATQSDILFCVPSIIEAWSRNPDYVQWLSGRLGVLFGGGPLNKEAGDFLVSKGVDIFVLYGGTEFGVPSPIIPAKSGVDWEYFKFSELVGASMVPYDSATNSFEFIAVSTPFYKPCVINTKVDGIDAYATSDLVVPHPTKEGYWKIYGRADDQIMHNTGEKTNPNPLETMLNQDPSVLTSVMFGRGRFYAGILVDPQPHLRFDPSDESRLVQFRNKIWSTIERMNAYAPQHSRLFKEMIIVSKPSKPFTYTAKNTPRRQAIIADYEDEINALYNAVEESTQSGITPPLHWDQQSTCAFVRKAVSSVMGRTISDDDDIFQQGCDSLQATWIRNSILRAVQESTQANIREINGNFVFQYPSIAHLSCFVLGVVHGSHSHHDTTLAQRVAAMEAMVERYSQDFPLHQSANIPLDFTGAVVLVTGTTGALGCYLLAQLVSSPTVTRVYALNRRSVNGISLQARQKECLLDRGVDVAIIASKKVTLLEGDPSFEQFGLSDGTYREMQSSVTLIIHNAWPVNFNLALASFDANVKGVRRLIDFALTSPLSIPVRVVYTSSIGVFQNARENKLMLEAPIKPDVAISSGYTQSKWVSEEILMNAARKTPLKPLIVRVGQLAGGLSGAWNISEWVPALIQSAEALRCLPMDDKPVSWIPLHVAAKALVELASAPDTPSNHIVHIVHPRPVAWSVLASTLSSEFSVPLVPYHEWLSKLEACNSEDTNTDIQSTLLERCRALRLLSFFKNIARDTSRGEAMGFQELDVTQARAFSSTMADPFLPQLGRDDVLSWIRYWRRSGLLSETCRK